MWQKVFFKEGYSSTQKGSTWRSQVPCSQCGHQATTKGSLTQHKRALHERVRYPCSACGKQFSLKGDIFQHKRAVHEGVKFPFRECNYQSTTKGNLAKHKKAVHEGVKYPWGHCGKQFSRKNNLARHYESYLNIKPIKIGNDRQAGVEVHGRIMFSFCWKS